MEYQDLLKKRRPLGDNLARFGSIIATGKPPADDDYIDKIYAREAIQDQFRNPLDDEVKRSTIAANNAMANGPVPTGFTRIGNKIVQDPSYEKPMNQAQRMKADADQRALDYQTNSVNEKAQDMLDTIGEVKKGMKYFGPLGDLPSIPVVTGDYDERKNWEANMNKLSSSKVLQAIMDMKSASKTGATGFGQLSEKELATLENSSTALKRTLGQGDAMRYLNDIENSNRKILGMRVGGGHSFNSPEEADASGLPPGTKVSVNGRPYEIG